MEHTKGKLINGYGAGVTGPSTPVSYPTVAEAVAMEDWKNAGSIGEVPIPQHTVLTIGTKTIAIIPTNKKEGQTNAERLVKCWNEHDTLKAERDKLRGLLEKPAEWMLWIKLRNTCACEANSNCVSCVIAKELQIIEIALEQPQEKG